MICYKQLELGLYILVAEIVLGGAGGRWLEYPLGLSVRILFLVIFFIVWILKLQKRQVKFNFKNKKLFYVILILSLGYPLFFGIFMHFLHPKNLAYLINDANGWVFYLIFLPMASIINTREKLWNLIKIYFVSILAIGVILTLIYFASALQILNIWVVQNFLLEKGLKMGGKVGIMPDDALRVFLGSSIFLPFGLFMVLSLKNKLIEAGQKMHSLFFQVWKILAILFLYFSLIASYTRGIWIGSLLGLIFFLFWNDWKSRIKIFTGLVLLILMTQIIFQQVFHTSFFNTFLGRITSSVSIEKDPVSVGARISQIHILAKQILKHPFFGTGFGTVIADYREKVDAPFSFELGYLDMVLKFGIVGFAFWGLFILYLIFEALQILWFNFQINKSEKMLIVSLLTSVLVLLFVSGTSPFISAGFGILQILLLMIVIQVLGKSR